MFMTCVFFCIIIMLRCVHNDFEIELLVDFRNLRVMNLPLGFTLILVLFSFLGLPPLGGFFIKFFLFKVLLFSLSYF